MKIALVTTVLALGGNAYADQCAWVTPDAAAKAKQILTEHPEFVSYCEPCNQDAPSPPQFVTKVEVARNDESSAVVSNGLGVDLAYMYVRTSPDRYENVALLVGCDAHGVSPSLNVTEETKNGVMITPSNEPVRADVPLVEHYMPTVTLPPPPSVIVVKTHGPPLWLTVGIAGLIGSCASFTGVLVLATARRRKRALLPRAIDLTPR